MDPYELLKYHVTGAIERGEAEAIVEEPVCPEARALDTVSQIMDYENGDLSPEATVKLFQALVDSGLAWQLQGSYGRTAAAMIRDGLIHERK